MSIESTRQITREDAIDWLVSIQNDYKKYLEGLTNEQIETMLYQKTRITHKFDNFDVVDEITHP